MRWSGVVAVALVCGCQFGGGGEPPSLGSGVVAEGTDATGMAGATTSATELTATAGNDSALEGDDQPPADGTGPAVGTDGSAGNDDDSGTTGGEPNTPASTGETSTGPGQVEPGTSSGGSEETYVACTGGCPAEAPQCIPVNSLSFCTEPCRNASTCPQPTSGTANVICSTVGVCALDCALALCPTGMVCQTVGDLIGPYRCGWP